MNPITMAGGIAALALLGYTHFVAFSAGEHRVERKWDADKLVRLQKESSLKDQVTALERNLIGTQKEAQNAHIKESQAQSELITLQRARLSTVDRGLRDVTDKLAAGLRAQPDDSAALAECKTTASAYRAVFESCVGRYREMGDDAQVRLSDAVSRGLECERSYDAAEGLLKELAVQRP